MKKNILIAYYSQSGNTKRLAELIGQQTGGDVYEIVFLGTPNWGGSIAHPVLSFLKQCSLSGKTVFPFCTHGGGGADNIEADLKVVCPDAEIKKTFDIYGNGGASAMQKVENWIGDLR